MIIESIGVIWGQKYIENFFQYSIQHFISIKNIDYIKQKKLNFNIIFKQSEINIVEKLENKNHLPFINKIFLPDYYFQGNKYETHSYLIKKFLKTIHDNSYVFLMYPDTIISNNFFKVLFETKNDYDLFFMPGLKTVINNENKFFYEKKDYLGISTSLLTNFIYNNLHVKMKLMTLNDKYYNNAPAWLIYNDPKGLIVRSFHLTPILFKNKLIKNNISNNNSGIDEQLTSNYLTNKIKFFSNTKKISWCSYEDETAEDFEIYKNTKNFKASIIWIDSCVTNYQKFLFKKYVFYLSPKFENIKYLKLIKFPFLIPFLIYFFKKQVSFLIRIINKYK